MISLKGTWNRDNTLDITWFAFFSGYPVVLPHSHHRPFSSFFTHRLCPLNLDTVVSPVTPAMCKQQEARRGQVFPVSRVTEVPTLFPAVGRGGGCGLWACHGEKPGGPKVGQDKQRERVQEAMQVRRAAGRGGDVENGTLILNRVSLHRIRDLGPGSTEGLLCKCFVWGYTFLRVLRKG